jgi:hypothetical protein
VSRARDLAFAVAAAAFGLMWLGAAVSKIAGPVGQYELLTHAVPAGTPAKAAFVVGATAESLLGAAMLLRAVTPLKGFVLSLVGLAVAAGVLLHVQAQPNAPLLCGCFGDAVPGTIEGELMLDAGMAAVLVGLVGWGTLFKRDA